MPYAYQAEMYCDDCAEEIMRAIHPTCTCSTDWFSDVAGNHKKDCPLHDWTAPEDSDDYPQKDTSSGEADTPQHCADCGTFLENPLTDDGYRYVQEKLNEQGSASTLQTWANFYGFSWQGWTTDQCNLDD